MVPKQPVATTVLYEKLVDDGKDSVFWIPKPLQANFTKDSDGVKRFYGTFKNEYKAFMSLKTCHGGEHIQATGQQQIAKHGVFPTLPSGLAENFKPREGARIAITARISRENAREGVQRFLDKGAYKEVIDTPPIAIEWNPFVN